MITKKVNRYYCEYCKKAGCNKFYMERHEKHCTANPNRECRMCVYAELEQTKITDEILSIIPDPNKYLVRSYPYGRDMPENFEMVVSEKYDEPLKKAFEEIKEKVNDCPACLLSVVKLAIKKYGQTIQFPFDFKRESESFLADYTPKTCPGDIY